MSRCKVINKKVPKSEQHGEGTGSFVTLGVITQAPPIQRHSQSCSQTMCHPIPLFTTKSWVPDFRKRPGSLPEMEV